MNGTWESTEVELIQNHALRWELDRLICSREGNKFKWIEELQESQSYGTEELFSVDRELYHDENSLKISLQFSSVQFSSSIVSDSLRPHESQHARPPCPSPSPGVRPNSCPSSGWCHPAISPSVVPFSSCPPASESFPMSQFFTWGGQSTGVSASALFLPKNTQGWSPLGWTG